MRRDLVATKMRFGGRTFWTIKDPASLKYYQLREEEYYLLRSLDGQTSVAAIRHGFEQRFAPLRLGDRQMQAFFGMLHGQGLVVADLPGQGQQLLNRRRRSRRRHWLETLTSVLAIRFRGIDPERFLRWLYPKCGWLFSRWCVAAVVVLALAALTLLVIQYETMLSRLPSFHAFFNVQNLVWIAVALAVAKIIHEFGHALACKRYGGQCHELGVMFLVFTPCLYCNVSDAWLMPNKWHRMAISAAGIYLEILLASLCTFLWWFSEPGLLNAICLNTMFVCSVSTVLFNGNPLLRYDGYYLLSDLWEVPNLRQQSTAVIRQHFARWILGVRLASARMLPEKQTTLLAVYAVVAALYRIIVIVAILWFVHAILEPHGLQALAQLLTLIVLAGMLVVPLWGVARGIRNVMQTQPATLLRGGISLGFLLALIVAACSLPLPRRVAAPVIIQPQDADRVYVAVSGRLVQSIKAGQRVERGDVLATLEDPEIDKEIEQLRGHLSVLRVRVATLNVRRVQDASAADQLPAAEEALRNVEVRLQQKEEERQRLTIKAPSGGIVLPAPTTTMPRVPDELATWLGTPLDKDNLGCFLESGTWFCLIGDPQRLEATVIIDQGDIEFVQPGQRVRLWFGEVPGTGLWGTVLEVAESQLDVAPTALAASGQLAIIRDETGVARPVNASFQARVELDAQSAPLLLGTTGRAKIHVAAQSLAARVYRYVCSTFRFEL